MTAESTPLTIRMCLRIDATADGALYRVTIDVLDPTITIIAVDTLLGRAIQFAADRCAARLSDHGYVVNSDEVLDSLDTVDDPSGPTGIGPS